MSSRESGNARGDRLERVGADEPIEKKRRALLVERLGERLSPGEFTAHEEHALDPLTTLRIGGRADLLVHAKSQGAVRETLSVAKELEIPVLLLGGGSNLLVSDEGWRGVTVHVACDRMDFAGDECWVEAGADFLEFIYACRDRALSGLEFAAGVPGSVGGAVYGNAGCYGKSIGEFLVEAVICELDGSRARTVPGSFFQFAYRDSRLKREPKVVLAARIRLEPSSREEIQAVIDARLDERRVKHPDWRREPTAGSYFKNLPPPRPGEHRTPAGRILDQARCRNLRVGDATVFSKHANIIVNAGRATAREVLTLAEVMRSRARRRFGVRLEEEVLFVGRRPRLLAHPELDDPSPGTA